MEEGTVVGVEAAGPVGGRTGATEGRVAMPRMLVMGGLIPAGGPTGFAGITLGRAGGGRATGVAESGLAMGGSAAVVVRGATGAGVD